jgi:hypothetical protein
VKVRSLFVAEPQSPELIQPGEGPFDDPSPSAQSAAMLGVAFRKKRDDASVTQTLPDLTPRHNHGRPNSQSGRWRGRPRSPCKLGIASTSARACCESLRLAPVS